VVGIRYKGIRYKDNVRSLMFNYKFTIIKQRLNRKRIFQRILRRTHDLLITILILIKKKPVKKFPGFFGAGEGIFQRILRRTPDLLITILNLKKENP
jgi:hypothetical protein